MPLAVSNGVVLAIGDDPGLHIWKSDGQGWSHDLEPTAPFSQRLNAVIIDSAGVPYIVGDDGVYHGKGAPPWTWQLVAATEHAQLVAVAGDKTIRVAKNSSDGASVVCFRADGTTFGTTARIPATNWFMQVLGQIPAFGNWRVRVIALTADVDPNGQYYAVTNQGAVFAATCSGNRTYVGQTAFWKVFQTQLAVREDPPGKTWLFWANGEGLRKLPIY